MLAARPVSALCLLMRDAATPAPRVALAAISVSLPILRISTHMRNCSYTSLYPCYAACQPPCTMVVAAHPGCLLRPTGLQTALHRAVI